MDHIPLYPWMGAVLLGIYFVLKHLRFRLSLPDIVKPILAGFVTYAILNMFDGINFLLGGVLEIGIYGGILLAMKTFTREEMSFFREIFKLASSADATSV
jgi:hypothetical protein